MRELEHKVQAAYFQWARLHPRARRAFAVPNGRKRSLSEAGKLKAEGVRAGVLDVFLPIPAGGAAGLWIEFKAGRNDFTVEQSAEAGELVKDGYAVAVVWDAAVAVEVTQLYLAGEIGPAFMRCK